MTTPRRQASTSNPLLPLSFALACGLWLYRDGLRDLFFRWSHQPEYSHGFLIPLISLYLLWERRRQLRPEQAGNPASVGLVVLALLLLFVGEISALYILIHYSLWLFLLALAWSYLGTALRCALAPIGLLIFAIPLPYYLEVIATSSLQLWSSQIGVALIRLFQIPVFLSGNIIDLGNVKLHVVEACSGLRYLFPLACLGFVAAYFYQARLAFRALVFASSVPITILLNSARIGLTGIISAWFNESWALSFLHNFEAWFFFMLSVAVLLLEIKLIERFTLRRSLKDIFATPKMASEPDGDLPPPKANRALLALCPLLVVALLLWQQTGQREEQTPAHQALLAFPSQIGEWQGETATLEQEIIDGLQFSDYFLANYRREDAASELNFYLAYYANQRKGASPHSPKVCIPGGGWEITEFSREQLAGMPVNRALIEMGLQQQLVYYWFVERGRVVANEYQKKWWLLKDSLQSNRSDGALVRVVIPVERLGGIAQAQARAEEFVQAVQPVVLRYLPPPPSGLSH